MFGALKLIVEGLAGVLKFGWLNRSREDYPEVIAGRGISSVLAAYAARSSRELLSERQVLQGEDLTRMKEANKHSKPEPEEAEHRRDL